MKNSKEVLILVILVFIVLVSTARARTVSLAWDENPEPEVAGYNVYYSIGTPGPPYAGTGAMEGDSPIDAGAATTFTVSNLPTAETVYFSVTAYTSTGLESDYATAVESVPTPSNQLPLAQDDSGSGFGTNEDLPFITGNVLANDSDADGDTITVSQYDSVSTGGGSVSYNGDGTFTYAPAADFNGSDIFTYKINDGKADSTSAARVTITVEPVNDLPVGNDDAGSSFTTSEDQPFITGNVLENDLDADGDVLSVTSYDVSSTYGGGVVYNDDGTFSYTPAANFNGLDSFSYTITDGIAASGSPAVVSIDVTPVNDAPKISGEPDLTVLSGQEYRFTPTAEDAEGEPLVFSVAGLPPWAALDTSSGILSGTPGYDAVGLYSNIMISVSDGVDSDQLPSFTVEVLPDRDTDGIQDSEDNCSVEPNSAQLDTDLDGVGDACDNCPDAYNPAQDDVCTVQTGSISGTVYDAASAGIGGVIMQACVNVGGSWDCSRESTTDVDGTYNITSLDAGQYQVRAIAGATGYVDEVYDNSLDPHSWTPVDLAGSSVTTGIDFVLERAGSVSGTVVDTSGRPAAGLSVSVSRDVFDAEMDLASDVTDAEGRYRLEGVPAGDVFVVVRSGDSRLVGEFWPDAHNKLDAVPVGVSAGMETVDIDFQLENGVVATGRLVTGEGSPVSSGEVVVFSVDEKRWHFYSTLQGGIVDSSTGEFRIVLPAGTYKLWAGSHDSSSSYRYYMSGTDGTYDFTRATEVPVTGAETDGVLSSPLDTKIYADAMSVSGSIDYTGSQQGRLLYMATPAVGNDFPALASIDSGGPGAFSLELPPGSWYVQGFVDINANLAHDAGEPFGEYPSPVSGGATGIDIRLSDPLDSDGDGIPDSQDNCPSVDNSGQADKDSDGIGDACTPPATDVELFLQKPVSPVEGDDVVFLVSGSGGSGRYEYRHRYYYKGKWSPFSAWSERQDFTIYGIDSGRYNVEVLCRSIGRTNGYDVVNTVPVKIRKK